MLACPLYACSTVKLQEYIWYNDNGEALTIPQAEGGEQGDPLMPALFALGQHPALRDTRASLRPDEHLFAFLDDIYIICELCRYKKPNNEIEPP